MFPVKKTYLKTQPVIWGSNYYEYIDLLNHSGQENFEGSNLNETDDILCYVHVPLKCPDLQNTTVLPNKQYATIGCQLYSLKISIEKLLR